jgi:hypothetical protein
MAEQTTRLVIAKMFGYSETIEAVSSWHEKRANAPLQTVKGDGRNQIHFVQDPVKTYEPITLKLHPEKNKLMVSTMRSLFAQQLLDPDTAQPVLIQSLKDDGSVNDAISAIKCVIQGIKGAEGETTNHALATVEIEVQPTGLVGSA